ncbi:MAG: alpha/beta fold hydrolase [Euryarchaeota archaeon]|nr:alpha/beta fold hydrolase [Euryarchaeota archaeon]
MKPPGPLPRPLLALGALVVLALALSPQIPPPRIDTPDLSFWDLRGLEEPTRATREATRTIPNQTGPLVESQVRFYSETHKGETITIHGYLYHPPGARGLPGYIFLHGFGGQAEGDLQWLAENMSRLYNVTTLALSSPGQGKSTGPGNTPETLARVEGGPQDSYLARNVYMAMRAVTVLRGMEEVDPDKIAILGGSQGGVTSFLAAALDPRIRAAVPAVASGDFIDSARRGSALNILVPSRVTAESPETRRLAGAFDPKFYLPRLRKPVLMLIGTDDEFFNWPAAMRTYEALPGPRAMSLLPNMGHAYHGPWNDAVPYFLDHYLRGGPPYARIEEQTEPQPDGSIRITTRIQNADRAVLHTRGEFPWDRFDTRPMEPQGDAWTTFLPPGATGTLYYTSAIGRGVIQDSAPIQVLPPSPLLQALLFLIPLGAAAGLAHRLQVPLRRRLETPGARFRLLCAITASLATLLPFAEFSGRTRLTFWEATREYSPQVHPMLPLLVAAATLLLPLLVLRWPRLAGLLALVPASLTTGLMLLANILSKGIVALLPGGGTLLVMGCGALILWSAHQSRRETVPGPPPDAAQARG